MKKKKKNYHHKSPIFLKDVNIEKVLISNKISSCEKKKNSNTLLVTCIMIIKLSHMFPETSTYLKFMMAKPNGFIF